MVSARGEVKLLDFGVVKTSETRLARTEVGVVEGNVTYMAPEQARGLVVDARADLYSLALVIYMVGAGRPLYRDDTTAGLLMKAAAGPGGEDRAAIGDLPDPLAAVVSRATAAFIVELFGPELKDEAHRMATFARSGAAIRLSSG
jgi:serine/threonine-protein kinase